MKKIIISLLGFFYGILSSWCLLLAFAFMFPDSSLGSKDYEEDQLAIPIGIIMLLFWITVTLFSYYKLRKKATKTYIIIFSVSLVIGVLTLFFKFIF